MSKACVMWRHLMCFPSSFYSFVINLSIWGEREYKKLKKRNVKTVL